MAQESPGTIRLEEVGDDDVSAGQSRSAEMNRAGARVATSRAALQATGGYVRYGRIAPFKERHDVRMHQKNIPS